MFHAVLRVCVSVALTVLVSVNATAQSKVQTSPPIEVERFKFREVLNNKAYLYDCVSEFCSSDTSVSYLIRKITGRVTLKEFSKHRQKEARDLEQRLPAGTRVTVGEPYLLDRKPTMRLSTTMITKYPDGRKVFTVVTIAYHGDTRFSIVSTSSNQLWAGVSNVMMFRALDKVVRGQR